MKRFAILALLLYFGLPNANAALIVKPLKQFAQVDSEAIGVVASGEDILAYGNREKKGFAQIINGPTIDLNCGVESFVSAATVDKDGNFYIAGAAANLIVGTLPPITGVLNPDNVIPDPVSSNKSDATTLCYWKLDSSGKVVESNSMQINDPIIPNSILVDSFGITIAGASYSNPGYRGFVLNWNSPIAYIGKSSSQVFALARSGDGKTIAVGQSSEKLLDRSLKGKSDGFLAMISNGRLIAIQRSSDIKATRAWRSVTNNLILGGFSNTNAVVTKFTSNFTPVWTSRYPASGSAFTAMNGKYSYAAFVSTGPIKSIPTWKRRNAALILTFDAKGLIANANYLDSAQIKGITANSSYGAILLSGGFLYRA